MNWFRNLRILNKLLISFLIIITIGAFGLVLNIIDMQGTSRATDRMVNETKKVIALREFQSVYFSVEMYERSFLLTGNEEFLEKREEAEKLAQNHLSTAIALVNAEEKKEFNKLIEIMKGEEEFPRVVELFKAGKKKEATALTQELYGKVLDETDEEISKIVTNAQQRLNEANRQTQQQVRKTIATSIIVAIAAVLLSFIIGIGLARSITNPIAHFRDIAEKVSLGDLGVKISVDQKNEIGELGSAFERMVTAVKFFAAENESLEKAERKEGDA